MSSIPNHVAAWLLSAALACVCSAQSLPSIFSSDVAAKVTQLTGQVSVSEGLYSVGSAGRQCPCRCDR